MQTTRSKIIKYVIIVFSFLTAVGVGLHYYAEYANDLLIYSYFVISNAVGCFFFNQSIEIEDVYEQIASGSVVNVFIYRLYELIIILAPICTATVVISSIKTFKLFMKEFWIMFLSLFSKSIVIFGYNDDVKSLLDNEKQNKDSDFHNAIFYIFPKTKISVDDRLLLTNNNALVIGDLSTDIDEILSKNKRALTIVRCADRIIFLDEQDTENIILSTKLYKCIMENNITFKKDMKMLCCITNYFKKVFYENKFNEKVKCMKDEDLKFDIGIFDKYQLIVDKVLNEKSFNISEDIHKKEIRQMIIGFGDLGQRLMTEIIPLCVNSVDGHVEVFILASDMHSSINHFLNRIDTNYFKKCNDFDETIYKCDGLDLDDYMHYHISTTCQNGVLSGTDGALDIYFYSVDSDSRLYKDLLDSISKKPIDNTFICIKNEDMIVTSLVNIANNKNFIKLYAREIGNAKAKNLIDDSCTDMPSDSEIVSIKGIADEQNIIFYKKYLLYTTALYKIFENQAYNVKKFSDEYRDKKMDGTYFINGLDKYISDNKINADVLWKRASFINKKRIVSSINHTKLIKKKLYSSDFDNILLDLMNLVVASREELLKYLNSEKYAPIYELMKIEHRRFCYELLFEGLSYDENAKLSQQEKWILPYERIINDTNYPVMQDFLSLMLEYLQRKYNE